MINPQDLVAKMKSQHLALGASLASILEDSKNNKAGVGKNIFAKLIRLKNDLIEHLELENVEFYPDYMIKQEKRGADLSSTKEFIKQMDKIGEAVMVFLDKYNSPELIEKDLVVFHHELYKLIGTLNARIETEEDGLFDLYLMI